MFISDTEWLMWCYASWGTGLSAEWGFELRGESWDGFGKVETIIF